MKNNDITGAYSIWAGNNEYCDIDEMIFLPSGGKIKGTPVGVFESVRIHSKMSLPR